MCQFFSGLITKDKTYYDLDSDSHEDLIKKSGLKDTSNSPDFVRVELLPEDKDIFNHNIKNWKIKVDQDFRPDWFSEKFAESEMKKAIKILWKKRFIINSKDYIEIKNQRIFIKNSKIKVFKCSVVARDNSSVVARENSIVKAWGNSSVVARDNSSVKAWDNSRVEAWENSSVVARDNSSVKAWDNSRVEAWENSSVEAWDNSNVNIPYSQNIKIKGVYDFASIKDIPNNRIIFANNFKLEIKK